MDSIFDEDVDEVGGEIEAYCPSSRCKADTTHTIISMYEDEVRRVQCVVCGDVHAYRKPRGDAYEDVAEPPLRKRLLSQKPAWEEAMARVTEGELAKARPYSIRDTYEEMDIVSHPTFDVGFVTELLPDNKVEVTFKDERRILVHNRGDLSERMPSIASIPAPREDKKRKRRKKKSAPPPPPVAQGNEDMAPEELQKALEQAEQARKAAAEKATTEKRKLSKRLAVEQIRAKRAHLDDDKPARGKKGKAAAAPAAGTVKKGAKLTVVLPPPGDTGRKPAPAPARGAKKAVKAAPTRAAATARKPVAKAVKPAAKKPAARKPAANAKTAKPAARKPAANAKTAKPAARKPAAKAAKPAAKKSAPKAAKPAAKKSAPKKPAAKKPAPKKAVGRGNSRSAPGRKRSTPRRKS
jgi:hypothetical protein